VQILAYVNDVEEKKTVTIVTGFTRCSFGVIPNADQLQLCWHLHNPVSQRERVLGLIGRIRVHYFRFRPNPAAGLAGFVLGL
jgi:hypothetical protein